ncbi:hypothetical protein C8R46DRAFT_1069841 [Mycena filopes]|nr:hypothetical protein C8R46DRAFT_1069841 [Mycena filopes]
MRTFYPYKIFAHPRLKDLTYLFRLDNDSSILEATCYDPFECMSTTNPMLSAVKDLIMLSSQPRCGIM